MTPIVATRLLALNRQFYTDMAAAFAESRATPQPGFMPLLAAWPQPCRRILDAGCGEGRFGRFLAAHGLGVEYVGVDFSAELLTHARRALPQAHFYACDLTQPANLTDLGRFEAVVCLAVLQHIPGVANRLALLRALADRLTPGGRLFLSHWQLLDSPRQQRKLRPWAAVGLSADDVEPHDYLVTWQRGGHGLRYVAWIDLEAMQAMAAVVGLRLYDHFYSDGREGCLNLYVILERVEGDGFGRTP